jgi:hypothetical protein
LDITYSSIMERENKENNYYPRLMETGIPYVFIKGLMPDTKYQEFQSALPYRLKFKMVPGDYRVFND